MGTAGDVEELLFAGDVGTFRERWRIWSARRAKPTKARDATVGQIAKIVGIARPVEGPTMAPFTKRAVVAWRTRLDAHRFGQFGEGTQSQMTWVTAFREAFAAPFIVEDERERGHVLVEAGSAAVLAARDVDVSEAPSVNDDNPELRRFLIEHHVRATLFMGVAGEHRFYEAVIEPGQRIAVWGRVAEKSEVTNAGYRDGIAVTKTILGSVAEPCVIVRL